jgi:hypothetical protein
MPATSARPTAPLTTPLAMATVLELSKLEPLLELSLGELLEVGLLLGEPASVFELSEFAIGCQHHE